MPWNSSPPAGEVANRVLQGTASYHGGRRVLQDTTAEQLRFTDDALARPFGVPSWKEPVELLAKLRQRAERCSSLSPPGSPAVITLVILLHILYQL